MRRYRKLSVRRRGAIVLIMHRLRENDLLGHFQAYEPWEVVRYLGDRRGGRAAPDRDRAEGSDDLADQTVAITVAAPALPALSDNAPNSFPRENDHRAAPGIAGGRPRRGLSASNFDANRDGAAPLHRARGAAARA